MIRVRALIAAAVLVLGCASLAEAQSFPERPIRLVVPFPAGGGTDTSARLVAQAMSSRLGQSVVIENQSGAGGIIGMRQVATANPDGYTLLMVGTANTFGTAPLLYKLDYDPRKAFAPVAMAAIERQLLVVTPSWPVKTLQELVAYAKVNPGKLNYGSSIGIIPHFLMELFKVKSGADIVHVPYRGGAPMITDLLAGHIDMTINAKSQLLVHVQDGRLRALAVTSAKRWRQLPDTPTMTEAGYLDGPYDTLFGVVAPAGTPAAVIDKLNAAVNDGLRAADVRASFAKLGIEPATGTPAEFATIIAEGVPKWAEMVRISGIKGVQ
jgi:tripartite-type tricarboxylate transporter receptor subunit TctC